MELLKLGLVADPVIEAIARLEFEDGMRTGVLPGGCWSSRLPGIRMGSYVHIRHHIRAAI